ncbi:hypothetical protein ACOMHN_044505 [Nucella lapillus]
MMVNEKSQADGLRARVISYMCSHFSDYADVDEHTLNADLPPWIHFSTVEKRIAAMAEPQSLPGELEICATSKVLNKQIIVINSNNVVIQRSGQGDNSPLIVQFTSFGEDVGHYDCVIKNTAPTETSSTTSNPNESIMEIINDLSPIPKMQPKRKSAGRKREVAEVLTSSPYKAKLVERQAKKKATEEKKKVAKEKKKVAESRNKPKAGNSKTKARKGKRRRQESDEESSDENEEWPCLVHNVLEQYCGAQATGSLWMSYTLPTDLALPPPQDTLPPFSKDLQVLCLCTGRPPFLLTIYDLNLVYKEDLNLDAKEDTASVTFQSYFKF